MHERCTKDASHNQLSLMTEASGVAQLPDPLCDCIINFMDASSFVGLIKPDPLCDCIINFMDASCVNQMHARPPESKKQLSLHGYLHLYRYKPM